VNNVSEETIMGEDIEQPEEQQPEKKKQIRLRSPKAQLQQCADELSDIASADGVKSNNRVDALIRKADILTELARLVAKEKESETLAENTALKQQHAEYTIRISELESEVSHLRSTQNPVEIRTVPDPEAAEIRASLANAGGLIKNAGQVIQANVEEPTRLRIAAALVKRMGRGAQPFVSEICDFASVFTASQRSDDELQEVIDLAAPGARGMALQVAKATLASRGLEYTGPRKPVYRNEFDGEYLEEL
jgi:hypothetical protein